MPSSSLKELIAVEHALLEQLHVSMNAHMQLEEASLAEIEGAWGPAAGEAAASGMDLASYVEALAAHEERQLAGSDHAKAAVYEAAAAHEEAYAYAEAEAAAAGMDLDTYAAVLAEAQAADFDDGQAVAAPGGAAAQAQLYGLAEQEAAMVGMDLETYLGLLAEMEAAEMEAAEMAHLHAQNGGELSEATAYALAEQEAAAAGMDLPSYAAALHGATGAQPEDEQDLLEALAYEEGLALHRAELEAHHAAAIGLQGFTPYDIAILQQHQLAQQQALGPLG